jgi:hypothetical protein
MGRKRTKAWHWRRVLVLLALSICASCDDNVDGPSGGGSGDSAQSANQSNAALAQSGAGLLATAEGYAGVLSTDPGPATDYGNLGGAYAVSQIINATYGTNLNTTSTDQLYDWLRSGFGTPVDPNTPGAVIISPSVAGYGGNVGIVGENGVVYSNNPDNGTWGPNNTVADWQQSFEGAGGTYAFVVSPGGIPNSSGTASADAPDPSVSGGPVGGIAALGDLAIVTSSTAKIDADADPTKAEYEPKTWQSETYSGYNSAQTPFVVVTEAQMENEGVSMGDWALVTNNGTGQQAWARVGDLGPAGGSGEISEAAATAVGIRFLNSTATIGNPSVTVQIYPGTRKIQSM